MSVQDLDTARFKECVAVGKKFYSTTKLLWKYSDLMNIKSDISLTDFTHFYGGTSNNAVTFSKGRNENPFNSMTRGVFNEPIDGVQRENRETETLEIFKVSAHAKFFINFYKYLSLYDYLNHYSRMYSHYKTNILKELYKVISEEVPIEVNIGRQFIIYRVGSKSNKRQYGRIEAGRHSLVVMMYISDEMLKFIKRIIGIICMSTHFFNYIYGGNSSRLMRKLVYTYSTWNPYEDSLIESFSEYRTSSRIQRNLFDVENGRGFY